MEKQDKREENYQKLLSDMTEKYAVVEDIRNSVDEIQKKVEMLSTEQEVLEKDCSIWNQITYYLMDR